MIGVDIEKIKRFENLDKKYLEGLFTRHEIEQCFSQKNPSQHLAGKFCAKEAIKKASGKNMGMLDIEIKNSEDGRPVCNIFGVAISISHDEDTAIAMAKVFIDDKSRISDGDRKDRQDKKDT